MRVLVTGGTGFLGRWVTQGLKARRHRPLAIGSSVDLRDLKTTRDAVRGHDAVVHLAARVGGIAANVKNPGLFYYENALMGQNVIEAARLEGVSKVVVVGTACEYPADCDVPMMERDIWRGFPPDDTAPYGLAKRGLYAMGQAYREEYGIEVEHVIPTNLYGPYDHFDPDNGHAIASMIYKCSRIQQMQGLYVDLWGTGTPTRDFLHASDAALGIVYAVERPTDGFAINLGSGVETSITDVAHMIAKLYQLEEVRFDASRPDGARRRLLSTDRAARLLSWFSTIPLERGIRETVNWYEDWDL